MKILIVGAINALLIAALASAPAQAQSARLPDPKLTPGVATNETAATLCKKTFHTADVRTVTESEKNEVYRRYGLKPNTGYCTPRPYKTKKGKKIKQGCEVDHLISLEIGGANDIENLWPQPYTENPGAHDKDKLENWLHKQVCTGKMTLPEAQKAIATDWFAEYQKMPQ